MGLQFAGQGVSVKEIAKMSEDTFRKEDVHTALESFTNWGNSGVEYVAKTYGDRAAVDYLRECGYALVRPVVENAGKEGE